MRVDLTIPITGITSAAVIPLVQRKVENDLTTHTFNLSLFKDPLKRQQGKAKGEAYYDIPYHETREAAATYAASLNIAPVELNDGKRQAEQHLLIPFEGRSPLFIDGFYSDLGSRQTRLIKRKGRQTFNAKSTSCFTRLNRENFIDGSSCFILEDFLDNPRQQSKNVQIRNSENVFVYNSSNVEIDNCSNLIVVGCNGQEKSKPLRLQSIHNGVVYLDRLQGEDGLDVALPAYFGYDFYIGLTIREDLARRAGCKTVKEYDEALNIALHENPGILAEWISKQNESGSVELSLSDLAEIAKLGKKSTEEKTKRKRT